MPKLRVAKCDDNLFEKKVAEVLEKGTARVKEAVERAEKYPNCTQLSSSRDEKLTLERFLDWCEENNTVLVDQSGQREEELFGSGRERLLLKYFEIDPVELEKERRAILAEQRKANGDAEEEG